LCCPSEYSVPLLVTRRCRRDPSSRSWLLVQSLGSAEVLPVLVRQARFAVSRSLGLAVFPRRTCGTQLSARTFLSSSFALRQSINQRTLAGRPKPPDTSHGLLSPTALKESEVHSPRGFHFPLGSALRVWLPSRRLAPSEPMPALFRTGGALGVYPSELSPLTRYRRVSTTMHPHTVSPVGAPTAEAASRPYRLRFLGFDPRESPWRPSRD
jgi:hypothetical protein